MECVFVRHGEASLKAPTDRQRELTERGHLQVAAAAQWLASNWRPERLLVSPYLRAQQTAAAFLAAMPGLRAAYAEFLVPDTPLQELNGELAAIEPQRVLLIGHNPLFSDAISWFCGDELREVMAPASMALIELPFVERNNGQLRWLRHAPDYSQASRQS